MLIESIFKALVRPLVGTGIGRIKPLANLYQKVASKVLPNEKVIEVQGFKIKVVTEGHISDISTELLFKGIHEPMSTMIFKRLINKGDNVVDVGANVGYFTLLSAKLVGFQGNVFAFEPDENNIDELRDNVRLNQFSNVFSYESALSDYNGRAKLFLSSSESARHSLIETNEHSSAKMVDIRKLDDIPECISNQIDFLKIDTEGNDLEVMKGGKETILRSKNIKILLEVYPQALEKRGNTVIDLWNYITNDLNMTHIYCVDDYKQKIFKVSLNMLLNYLKNTSLACNLLCSREKLVAFE